MIGPSPPKGFVLQKGKACVVYVQLVDRGGIDDGGIAHADHLAARICDRRETRDGISKSRIRVQKAGIIVVVIDRPVTEFVEVNFDPEFVIYHICLLG